MIFCAANRQSAVTVDNDRPGVDKRWSVVVNTEQRSGNLTLCVAFGAIIEVTIYTRQGAMFSTVQH